MACARDWLKTCLQDHTTCRSLTTSLKRARLPTRLIQLGQPSSDKVRLYVPGIADADSGLPYVTLSHCWGTANFLTLSADTIEKITQGVSIAVLPQTFQDAITVAEALQVSFIWIDSLCIFQDSVKDWQHEAPLMADVYRGAQCNIAANSRLQPRKSHTVEPCRIATLYSDRKNFEYVLFDTKLWENAFRESTLEKRAWIMQELLLAPRILYLHQRQLFWECFEQKACETFPHGLPESIKTMQRKGKSLLTASHPHPTIVSYTAANVHHLREDNQDQESGADQCAAELSSLSGSQAFEDSLDSASYSSPENPQNYAAKLWQATVTAYMACSLTRPSDKLLALSGVAQALQWAIDSEYVAGLWTRNIVPQLLWRADRPGGTRSVNEYRAPSWSWASVDGKITYDYVSEYDLFQVKVLGIEIDAIGGPFGPVTGGKLHLQAPLMTVEIFEELSFASIYPQYSIRVNGKYLYPPPQVYLDDPDQVYLDEPDVIHNLHLLPVNTSSYLILDPTYLPKGHFRRCGYVEFNKEQFTGECGWQNIKNEDWLEYEDFDGVERYTFFIL